MPPKADINTLLAKRDVAIKSLYELFEEFQVVYGIEPELETLEKVYKEIETKFRTVKKQLEVISDKIIENGISEDETVVKAHEKVGVEVKEIYLKCTASFVTYQKQYSKKGKILENQALAIGQMNSALKEMVQVLECKTNDKSHGLEKISVPSWDGQRRTYNTWKHEFTHWMKKYNQDNDEQLQRFRKA